MATAAQIAANQANAQKSTGPRTESGKAASKLNRFSHGFCSNSMLPKPERMNEYCDLIEALTLEYQPATTTEQILVEAMAKNQWLCLRAFRMQTELLEKDTPELKNLGLLIRYHSTAERGFHKAHTELVTAQKQRKNAEIGFVPQTTAEAAQKPQAEDSKSSAIPQKHDSLPELDGVGDPATAQAPESLRQAAKIKLPEAA